MKLTQVIDISPNPKTDAVLTNLAKISNGLWNNAVYESKQMYKNEKKFCFFYNLQDKFQENNELYPLLYSHSAQAVLQKYEGSLKSFISLKKKGYKDAKPPSFRPKNTEWVIPYKSGMRMKKGIIKLPMSLAYRKQTGISWIRFRIPKIRYEGTLKYLEIYKVEGKWKASLVFEVEGQKAKREKENLYIDLGVKNIATVYDGNKTTIFKGGKILAENQYKDMKVAKVQKVLSDTNKRTSKEKRRIARQAKRKIIHAIHSLTTKVVNDAKEQGKGIVVGNLTGIRKNMQFRRKTNQMNHQWLFGAIIMQLFYKANLIGVSIHQTNERCTSHVCALCGSHKNRKETRRKDNGCRRIKRGLYRCKLYNVVYNADAGGALNIQKKYLRVPLSKGSGIGVVDILARPAVFHWNEHEWLGENLLVRETMSVVNS